MTLPLRNPSVAWSRIGDEIFILNLRGDRRIHRLNPVASMIWNLTDGSRTPATIAEELAGAFDAPGENLKKDVADFFEDLRQEGLLEGSAAMARPNPPSTEEILLREMENLALSRNIPLFTTIELTLKCNLKCVHCYNFDRSKPAPKNIPGRELTTPELKTLLEDLSRAGALLVSFSGGEALLHPDLAPLVAHARSLHLGVKIKSNATLLTLDRAKELYKAGATEMDISLYGARAVTHDSFTEVRGSFERTLRGVLAARDAGIVPSLSFIIHRGNYREIPEMIALAGELGVHHSISTELTARYDGTTDSRDHRLSREQFEEMITGPAAHLFADLYHPSDSVQCACARLVCGINSTGEVYPCIGAPIASGNLREKSFTEIWNHSPELNKIRGLTLNDFRSCKPCPDRHYCQRSSGAVFTDTGDYTGPEASACMQAELVHRHHPKREADHSL